MPSAARLTSQSGGEAGNGRAASPAAIGRHYTTTATAIALRSTDPSDHAARAKAGDATTAAQQALTILNFSVDKQAYLLSYLDTYRLISLFFIAILPFIFFVKPKKKKAEEAAAAVKAAMEAH